VAIGAASILSGIAYTGGPFPLGYHGLGDAFVFVFFGLVAVGATFYVQAGSVDSGVMVAAVAIGALTTNILLANNYRDAATDAKAGKRTLVVRFGKRFARWQFATALGIAAAAPLCLGALGVFRMETGVAAALLSGGFGFGLGRPPRRIASGCWARAAAFSRDTPWSWRAQSWRADQNLAEIFAFSVALSIMPTYWSASWPPLKSSNVGMARMP
jgi:hypothetical protein